MQVVHTQRHSSGLKRPLACWQCAHRGAAGSLTADSLRVLHAHRRAAAQRRERQAAFGRGACSACMRSVCKRGGLKGWPAPVNMWQTLDRQLE